MRKGFAIPVGVLLILFSWTGSEVLGQDSFPKTIESEIGGKKVRLVLTGQAVRKKLLFSIYSVASYLQEGVQVRTPQDLIQADCPKVLHLKMMRTVSGNDMVESLLAVLRRNHPAPAFAEEATVLNEMMRSASAHKGDQILITHLPGVGLHFRHQGSGGREFVIRNPAFSRAVWEIYFGKHNVGEDVKKGLLGS